MFIIHFHFLALLAAPALIFQREQQLINIQTSNPSGRSIKETLKDIFHMLAYNIF
jgi:hypothetical protein